MEKPVVLTPKVFRDERGFFFESYRKGKDLQEDFVQDNHSYSTKDVLRGMHFQEGQGKLVRCGVGKVFDVAVDMRPNSPHFKKWYSVILDDQVHQQFYVPPGFAHGFCALSEEAHVLYKVTTFYDGEKEGGFLWSDPEIGIEWPVENPILSDRDRNAKAFGDVV